MEENSLDAFDLPTLPPRNTRLKAKAKVKPSHDVIVTTVPMSKSGDNDDVSKDGMAVPARKRKSGKAEILETESKPEINTPAHNTATKTAKSASTTVKTNMSKKPAVKRAKTAAVDSTQPTHATETVSKVGSTGGDVITFADDEDESGNGGHPTVATAQPAVKKQSTAARSQLPHIPQNRPVKRKKTVDTIDVSPALTSPPHVTAIDVDFEDENETPLPKTKRQALAQPKPTKRSKAIILPRLEDDDSDTTTEQPRPFSNPKPAPDQKVKAPRQRAQKQKTDSAVDVLESGNTEHVDVPSKRKKTTKSAENVVASPAPRSKPRSKQASATHSLEENAKSALVHDEDDDDDEVNMDGFESVEEDDIAPRSTVPIDPAGVQLELGGDESARALRLAKQTNYEEMWQKYIQQMVNRKFREYYESIHEVALLSWIAWGKFQNDICNREDLQALALSIVPSHLHIDDPVLMKADQQSDLLQWLFLNFKSETLTTTDSPLWPLQDCVAECLRARTGSPRVVSLAWLCILRALRLPVRLAIVADPPPLKPRDMKKILVTVANRETHFKQVPMFPDAATTPPKVKKNRGLAPAYSYDSPPATPNSSAAGTETEPPSSEKPKKVAKKRTKSEDTEESGTHVSATDRIKRRRSSAPSVTAPPERCYEPTDQRNLKCWVEIYSVNDQIWQPIHPSLQGAQDPATIMQQCFSVQPSYVLVVSKGGGIKDVTQRYAEKWNDVRRTRAPLPWLTKTLKLLQPKADDDDDFHERKGGAKKVVDADKMPTTISDFKNHPVYALERHILKFEAIYPRESICMYGKDPVYLRSQVHELHTKELWIKQARSIKEGEVPYKIVKSRPKMKTREIVDAPLFGEWQTEPYKRPVAVNGVVPRNEYGDVDVYQPSMVPIGCVHLKLPHISRVARRLNIDAVPALVGFEFKKGRSVPKLDGMIVCEEFEEVLRDACIEEEKAVLARERAKRSGEILDRWARITRALVHRHRLEEQFGEV